MEFDNITETKIEGGNRLTNALTGAAIGGLLAPKGSKGSGAIAGALVGSFLGGKRSRSRSKSRSRRSPRPRRKAIKRSRSYPLVRKVGKVYKGFKSPTWYAKVISNMSAKELQEKKEFCKGKGRGHILCRVLNGEYR
jgi:uncharacterized protein YcfJ